MIKFREAESKDWYHKIDEDGKAGPSFSNIGSIGRALWAELQKYIEDGHKILPKLIEEITPLTWQEKRIFEFEKQNVTREDWIDLDIIGDEEGKEDFRLKILKIKEEIPKE